MKVVGASGCDLVLQERLVAAVEGGMSAKEAARVFSVNVMTIYSYLELQRQGRLHVIGKPTRRPFRVTAVHEAQLLKQLEAHGDATLVEHAVRRPQGRPSYPGSMHARSGHWPEGQLQNGGPGVHTI